MNKRHWTLNRRTVLRGLGVSMGLPLLETMSWGKSKADQKKDKSPVRMAYLFMPNGVHQDHWTPSGTGRDFKFASINKPLEPVKDDLLVLTNLMNEQARHGDGHYVKTSGLLTGRRIHKTAGKDIRNGISVDQLAANTMGHKTAIPSIELAIEPTRTGVDTIVGFTQIYGGHISWQDENTPVPKEIYPQLAFNRLFNRKGNYEQDKSVIDYVLPQTKSLMNNVSAADKQKMAEYLASVRELEKRIENNRKNSKLNEFTLPKGTVAPPAGKPDKLADHMQQMLDLIVLAFQTHRTNVATFMFGNAVSGMNFSFVEGVNGGFHQLSHHAGNKDKLEQYRRINHFHMQMLVKMLLKMKSIKEGDGTLLDNSMIMCASGLRDGNSHAYVNLPVILAGKAGGQIETGQHLVFPEKTPLCKLYLSMLHAFGMNDIKSFGDANKGLLELKA